LEKANTLEKILLDLKEDNEKVLIWSRDKKQITKSLRGSKYRGVSRNGKKW
jgi:shikimate kinase